MEAKNEYEYDVTLTFAGEDRNFVSCVAEELIHAGIKIFYDEYEQIALWGKDLYIHLDDVFSKKARLCVMFVSKFYKEKLWTNFEREKAQARAFENNEEYILPFRLDDTEIPGLKDSTAFLSAKDFDCKKLAAAIIAKVAEKKGSKEGPPQKSIKKSTEPGIFMHENGDYEISIKKYEFFSQRLAKAFPGARGLKWFNSSEEIVRRLQIVLQEPLTFQIFPGKDFFLGGVTKPIWWFRGGSSLAIEKFEVITPTKVLLGSEEFEVEKLAVYRSAELYRDFIYLKSKSEPPIENGEDAKRLIEIQLSYKKYARQSYGIYRDHFVTTEEYEDGATEIEGEIVSFEETPTWRSRHLTPYNIIICAQSSVYNSREADLLFGDLLDLILENGNDEELEASLEPLLEIKNDSPFRIDFDLED